MLKSPAPSADLWPRRQFRAPAKDRGLLVEPTDRTPISITTANRLALDSATVSIGSESLADLRKASRRDVLRNACEYTTRLRGIRPEMPSIDDDLIVVGHQPGLFHPGVWLKHWSAAAIADRAGGVALNVIVDNDLCDGLEIRVPTGSAHSPSIERVPLDSGFQPRPWEDLRLQSPDEFRTAGVRLCDAMKGWGYEPIACEAWAQIQHVDQCDSVVDQLSRLRHQAQLSAGVTMLEVPMRNIARLPSFAQFVAFIVQNIATVSSAYNEGLAIYRRLNRLRSDSHPMPNLARDGRFFEVPLWVWRAGDRQRRPLWVQVDGCGARLFDRLGGNTKPIAFVRDGDCQWDTWFRMLTDLDHQGYRVRPRALMTTLFLRLCLADLFIHGIGGAKYDEVADWIIRQFVGIRPPEFITASGTLRLPIHEQADSVESESTLGEQVRDMQFNPDRHGASGPLVDEKQSLIAEQKSAENGHGSARQNRRRYTRIREINEQLTTQIADQIASAQDRLAAAHSNAAAAKILSGREYSWVLFPKDQLTGWLKESSAQIAGGNA